jgi:hypothetical protein
VRVHPEEGRARDLKLVEQVDDVPGNPVASQGEGRLLVDCFDEEPWLRLRANTTAVGR